MFFGSWFWLILLAVFIAIEAFTFSLTTIWCAIAALPMIFISLTGLNIQWQLLIFVILSIALIVFTRPLAIKKFKIGKEKTNIDSIKDQTVIVTETISKFSKGLVKTKNGTIWTAQSSQETDIPTGTECKIIKITGNTLEVMPL